MIIIWESGQIVRIEHQRNLSEHSKPLIENMHKRVPQYCVKKPQMGMLLIVYNGQIVFIMKSGFHNVQLQINNYYNFKTLQHGIVGGCIIRSLLVSSYATF